MNNMREEALRGSLYQFLGAVFNSYNSTEQAIAIILEELIKVITNNDLKSFQNDSIKPILKSAYFILSQKYDKQLEDSNRAFNNKIPAPIKMKLAQDKQLIDLLNKYIEQLGE